MARTFDSLEIDVDLDGPDEQRVKCPWCSSGRKKSNKRDLAVNVRDGVWLCHHCGEKGGLSNEPSPFARKQIKRDYVKPPAIRVAETLPDYVAEWGQTRHLSASTLRACNIDGCMKSMMNQVTGKWKEQRALRFRFMRDGQLVNIKYRGAGKNFMTEKDCERTLFGIDDMEEECVIIVEGEIDKASFWEAGFKSCVSVPDGAPDPGASSFHSKFDFLVSEQDRLEKIKKFVLAVDNDAPGLKLEEELARRLGKERCWRVRWPKGCKDANEVLMHEEYGIRGLMNCVKDAVPYPVDGIFDVDDIADRVRALYRHGVDYGVSSGWATLDPIYRIKTGEWTVVTGTPNSGKSEFVDAMMINLCVNEDWRVAMVPLEALPLETHFSRMAERYIGKSFGQLAANRMNDEDLDAAIAWAQEHIHYIVPDDDHLSLDSILKRTSALVYRYGIKGLVIDPWTELNDNCLSSGDQSNSSDYIGGKLTRIRRFARREGIHIWVVAHPQKLTLNRNDEFPKPELYHISGSAHWNNKADNGLCIWRDLYDTSNSLEVISRKVRNKNLGRPGTRVLWWEGATGRYYEEKPVWSYEEGVDYSALYRPAEDNDNAQETDPPPGLF